MEKIKVGVIGPGNIGQDLMIKIGRSKYLELACVVGIVESPGIQRARDMGVDASAPSQLKGMTNISSALDSTAASTSRWGPQLGAVWRAARHRSASEVSVRMARPRAEARARAVATPIRAPVKDPGPRSTAMAVRLPGPTPASRHRRSMRDMRVRASSRRLSNRVWAIRSPVARAMDATSVVVLRARITPLSPPRGAGRRAG